MALLIILRWLMTIGKIDGRWKVNGVDIPQPQEVHIEHTNVASDDSGRSEDGVMKLTWVRTDVKKVAMKWKVLTGNEVAAIKGLMQGKTYTFTYYDAGIQTMTAYTGDNDYDIYSYNPNLYGNDGGLYRDFSIDAVEM